MQQVSETFQQPVQHWIDVGHSRLAYRKIGRGPDVVFIHGWPLWSATWRHVVQELQDEFCCHLIDLPGSGETEAGANAPRTFDGHSQTMLRAIEILGLDEFSLVGHNSGGTIARLVAAKSGPAVRSLVVAGSEIPHRHSLLLRLFVALGKAPSLLWRRLLAIHCLRRSALLLGAAFHDGRHSDGDFERLFVRPLVDSQRAMAEQLRFLRDFSFDTVDGLAEVHGQIVAPTLLLWGKHDRIFPVQQARQQLRQFSAPAQLLELADAGTFVHEEKPLAFAGAVRAHLRGE